MINVYSCLQEEGSRRFWFENKAKYCLKHSHLPHCHPLVSWLWSAMWQHNVWTSQWNYAFFDISNNNSYQGKQDLWLLWKGYSQRYLFEISWPTFLDSQVSLNGPQAPEMTAYYLSATYIMYNTIPNFEQFQILSYQCWAVVCHCSCLFSVYWQWFKVIQRSAC